MSIVAAGFSPKSPDERGFLRYNEIENIRYINHLIKSGNLNEKSIITDIIEYDQLGGMYERLSNRKPNDLTFVLKW